MSLRSLRWQIQLWHAALLVILVGGTLVAFYGYEQRARVARIDAELTGPLVALLPRHIRLPGRTPPNAYDAENNNSVERALEASGHYLRVTAHDGRALYASPGAPDSAPVDLPERNDGIMRGRWNGDHRELINISPRGDVVILARHSASLAAELRAFTLKLTHFQRFADRLGVAPAPISFGLAATAEERERVAGLLADAGEQFLDLRGGLGVVHAPPREQRQPAPRGRLLDSPRRDHLRGAAKVIRGNYCAAAAGISAATATPISPSSRSRAASARSRSCRDCRRRSSARFLRSAAARARAWRRAATASGVHCRR